MGPTSHWKKMTNEISKKIKKKDVDEKTLVKLIHEFVTMYEYHEALEDTVIFPGFLKIADHGDIQRRLYHDYTDKDKDERLYKKSLKTIDDIESHLGISLDKTTPSLEKLSQLGIKMTEKDFEESSDEDSD